jgi:hypothetical protein
MNGYPIWATEKQREGIDKFSVIADKYGRFDIEFKPYNYAEEEQTADFLAEVTWGYEGSDCNGIRQHEMRIAWCHEETWDHLGNKVEEWQFVFASGECAREMTTEMFYMDLFTCLDSIAITKPDHEKKLKADAVMSFANTHVGAFESGFVNSSSCTIADIYQTARIHVKDNYDAEAKPINEVWGEELAKELSGKSESCSSKT